MNPNKKWPQDWHHEGKRFEVYPAVFKQVLNYGLSTRHMQLGTFPTAESIKLRMGGEKPYDSLEGAASGLRVGSFNVKTFAPGTTLYRFGPAGGYKGAWWTSRDGLFRMLMRAEPAKAGLPGVQDGSKFNLRDYARRYSEVLTGWSNMKYLFATRLLGRVNVISGMGASQASKEFVVYGPHGEPVAVTREQMSDDNRQIFIPNCISRLDGPCPGEPAFFQNPVRWHPEALEEKLVPAIRRRMGQGEGYRKIIVDVEDWMMQGKWRAPLPGDPGVS